jgi:hypothetical protein
MLVGAGDECRWIRNGFRFDLMTLVPDLTIRTLLAATACMACICAVFVPHALFVAAATMTIASINISKSLPPNAHSARAQCSSACFKCGASS